MEPPVPSTAGVIAFIDSIKNITVALIVLGVATYVSITPGIAETTTKTWLDYAAAVVFVYIGKRASSGNNSIGGEEK